MRSRFFIGVFSLLSLLALPSLLFALCAATAIANTTPSAQPAPPAPHTLYGESATYLVTRGGAPAGTHRLFFSGGGEGAPLTVTAETRATLSILGIFDVPFIYDSRAVWQSGALLTLSAAFSGEDAKNFWVRRNGDRYETQSGESTDAALLPTNHWNSEVLQRRTLYNTLNGNIIQVDIERRGADTLLIGGRQTAATRYDMSGDLDISLWYDDSGKWLRLQFKVLGNDYQFTYQPDGGGGDDGNGGGGDSDGSDSDGS